MSKRTKSLSNRVSNQAAVIAQLRGELATAAARAAAATALVQERAAAAPTPAAPAAPPAPPSMRAEFAKAKAAGPLATAIFLNDPEKYSALCAEVDRDRAAGKP